MMERAWRNAGQALILCFLVTMFHVAPTVAQEDTNTLQVLDIKVDITDRSADAARDKALANGERQAYDKLMSQLTSPRDAAALSSATAAEISNLVRDFWVTDEKVSSVRYLATLNYTFYRDRVYEHLRRKQVAAPVPPAEPLLVVPVYDGPAGMRLWEFDNAWKSAFQAAAPSSLLPLRFAAGDPSDQAMLSAEQAIAGDETAIRLLAGHYSSREVIIAVARHVDESPNRPASIRIEMTRHPGEGGFSPLDFSSEPDEPTDALLRRAAAGAVASLEASWKSEAQAVATTEQTLPVVIPVRGLEDWNTIRRRLNSTPDVENVAVVVLAREEIRANITFFGDVDRLRQLLLSSGLALSEDVGQWRLSLTTPTGSSATNKIVSP